MKKNAFTIIEISIVFFLILVVTSFVLPRSLNNTKHARLISKWSSNYSELEYIFSVLKAQNNLNVYEKIKTLPDNDAREEMVMNVVKPYMRIKYGVPTGQYQPRFMSGENLKKKDKYWIKNYYSTAAGEIIGLKWLVPECKSHMKNACGTMSIDINGEKAPNTWGEDIFGINIFSDRVEPIGKDKNIKDLRQDCSKDGTGVLCSYYYLIGGKFD